MLWTARTISRRMHYQLGKWQQTWSLVPAPSQVYRGSVCMQTIHWQARFLPTREGMFQRVVRESHERVKNQCDLRKKLGDSNFHDRLIVLYTKKAPQLSQELIVLTKNMAAAATKCCPLNQEHQFVCMEDSVSTPLAACLPIVGSSELQAPASISCQWTHLQS